MTKITKATFKSFVKKNADKLLVQVNSDFDGMTDGIQYVSASNRKFVKPTKETHEENTLGFSGIWLVGDSRDYFTEYNENNLKGFYVSNCCGSFIVAVEA